MRCEPQGTVIEREVRYYRYPSSNNDRLLRNGKEEGGHTNIFRKQAKSQIRQRPFPVVHCPILNVPPSTVESSGRGHQ